MEPVVMNDSELRWARLRKRAEEVIMVELNSEAQPVQRNFFKKRAIPFL
jgi:hypothetical protein